MATEGKPYDLKLRTKQFAISILQLIDELPKKKSTEIIAYQLGRSGSSVAANYRACSRAKSAKDFIHKLKIAEEECDETQFWLEVLIDGKFHDEPKTKELHSEATELVAIIVKSIQTARANSPD
jgi:four helix bundle protein